VVIAGVTVSGVIFFLLGGVTVYFVYVNVLSWIGGKIGETYGSSDDAMESNRTKGRQIGRILGWIAVVVTGVIFIVHGGLK
jgi:hypothetical protein